MSPSRMAANWIRKIGFFLKQKTRIIFVHTKKSRKSLNCHFQGSLRLNEGMQTRKQSANIRGQPASWPTWVETRAAAPARMKRYAPVAPQRFEKILDSSKATR